MQLLALPGCILLCPRIAVHCIQMRMEACKVISACKCRVKPSLNILSVGAFPVNISSRVIPKL
uniref:Bifunctional inhibitor/plant lipid transfer protein/seed storage helical domain-containing protein n=1 Tax=Oryza meridionalis TaxID=40149 RepID=A0A0E0C303_9ORYZ